jgi:hypothetical protein
MEANDPRFLVTQAFWQSRGELLAAIDGLDEEALAEPVIDGWSVKDHLAHVEHMDEIRFFEIQRVINGLHPIDPSVASSPQWTDTLNELGVEARRELPLNELLKLLEISRGLILDAVQSAPEEALDDSRYGEYGLSGGAAHERSHAQTIREWRKAEGL